MKTYDVIVIGAGAAGMTAAIYVKRANYEVAMIEKSAPGGQINKTAHVENYPGFGVIEGPELSMNMFNHTQELGIEYKYGDVIEIRNKDNLKKIVTDKETILARAVIIATGRKPRGLELENENRLTNKGISWCAICDGPLFKGKDVAVVGGGNSAVEEAIYLSEFVNKVTLIHRRDEFRADPISVEKLLKNKKIGIKYNSNITKYLEENGTLKGLEIINNKTNEKEQIKIDGLFIYIGSDPVTNMVNNYDIKDEEEYIIVDENNRTKEPFIYAAGDVTKKELYQISTAIGEGSKAAMSAVKDICE